MMTSYDDIMRTIIDIPSELLTPLDQYAKEQHQARASVIREALAAYLVTKRPSRKEEAFGMWKDRDIEGVAYQQRLRAEWDPA